MIFTIFTAEQKELIIEIVDREQSKYTDKVSKIDYLTDGWGKIEIKLANIGFATLITFEGRVFAKRKSLKIGNFYLNTYRGPYNDRLFLDKCQDFGIPLRWEDQTCYLLLSKRN